MASGIHNLEQLLGRITDASDSRNDVDLGSILDAVGRRSFAPLLLVAGLITVSPIIGDIPGVPTAMAIFIFLIAGQILIGRHHFWLPQWLLNRSVTTKKLKKVLAWMRRPAQFIDRHIRPRLATFVRPRLIAISCLAIAAAMPTMELIPFTANLAGAALTIFALSIMAHDGLLAIIAFSMTVLTLGLGLYFL